jgi:hypothetical protein
MKSPVPCFTPVPIEPGMTCLRDYPDKLHCITEKPVRLHHLPANEAEFFAHALPMSSF